MPDHRHLITLIFCAYMLGAGWGASCGFAAQHKDNPTPEQKKREYFSYTLNRYKRSKLVTPNPFPVKPGQIQIQLGYNYAATNNLGLNTWRLTRRPFLGQSIAFLTVETGVAEAFSLGLNAGYGYQIDNSLISPVTQGPIDVSILSKYLFTNVPHDPGANLAVGYYGFLTFPTGTQAGVSGLESNAKYFTFLNGVAVSYDFTKRFTSNYFAGYNWFFGRKSENISGVVVLQTGYGYMVTHWLQPIFEVTYQHEVARGNDSERAAVVGGFIITTQTTRITLGVQQSVAARNADLLTTIIAGVTVTF